MNGVCSSVYNNFNWGIGGFTKLTEKTASLRNAVTSLIGFTIFFEKMPPYLKHLSENFPSIATPANWLSDRIVPESLKFYKGRFEALKDPLSIVDWFCTVDDVFNPEKKLWSSSVAKIGNRCTKLVYTTLEAFLIIPNKWEMINLDKWCATVGTWSSRLSWVTTTNIFIVKECFVLAASGFGIWHATEEINKASGIVEKNEKRFTQLKEIQDAAGDAARVEQLAKAYELGKDKKPVVEKLFKEILAGHEQIQQLQASITQLEDEPVRNDNRIFAASKALNKLQDEMLKKEEKVRRIRYFAELYINEEIIRPARTTVVNEILNGKLNNSLDQIQNAALKQTISTILTVDPDIDLLERLNTIVQGLREGNPDRAILNGINQEVRAIHTKLFDIAPPAREASKNEKFQRVLASKIRKASWNMTMSDSQETKSRIVRWFEISKIAIVTLGMLTVTGLTLTYLASFAAAIAAVSWVTGLGVSVVGLTRTIYETFYFKDPKENVFRHTPVAPA